MDKIQYAEFLAEKDKHSREHQQRERELKDGYFDWEPLLDRLDIHGVQREKFLAQRKETVNQIPQLLGLMEGN